MAAAMTLGGLPRMVRGPLLTFSGVASNFERMVRIADSTGIELGDLLEQASADVRDALGLERPAGR